MKITDSGFGKPVASNLVRLRCATLYIQLRNRWIKHYNHYCIKVKTFPIQRFQHLRETKNRERQVSIVYNAIYIEWRNCRIQTAESQGRTATLSSLLQADTLDVL